uniref:WASH complex subunit 3 n=1 Tax=Prolemur simus TaxID=1328070 RepID=A0A8C9DT66_PROSS
MRTPSSFNNIFCYILKIMSSGKLLWVPDIQQNRTVVFLNHFVVYTVQFLNCFSMVCEECYISLLKIISAERQDGKDTMSQNFSLRRSFR